MNKKIIENNYAIIPNFISSGYAINLAKEFKEYCISNDIKGDDQVSQSCVSYNYISFLELLCDKTQEVSSIIEETVLPTYAYSRIYWNNSVLKKHKDRDACEISLTIHLDGDTPWLIYIQTPDDTEKSIMLNPGDALLYLGNIAEHWREPYEGEYYAQVFLHYVRSRGKYSYAYFDKQNEFIETNVKQNEFIETNVKQNEFIETNVKQNEFIENNKVLTKSNTNIILQCNTNPTDTLENFIKVYDNILSDEDCNFILNEYKDTNLWKKAKTINENYSYMRTCCEIPLSSLEIIDKNYDIRKKIDEVIFNGVKKIIEKYSCTFQNFNISTDNGYTLLKYEKGQQYGQHVDSCKEHPRELTCSIQLNDDYEGGELCLFDRQMMIRTKPGSAIVFPSNFMFPHEILPVNSGIRYSIITWLL